MTPDDDRIAQLEYQVRLLAWLHNELVHEINVLVAQAAGTGAIDAARMQAIRARAARIAQIRNQRDAATSVVRR